MNAPSKIWRFVRWPIIAIAIVLGFALAIALGLIIVGEIGNALHWWTL